MKRVSLYLGLHLLFTCIASAWNPFRLTRCLVQSVFSTEEPQSSQIPQLVLDTKHPWVTTNKAWLSRYPNVVDAICSRDSALWTSPASSDRAPPADLFNHLRVNSNGIQPGGCYEQPEWSNVQHRLRELASCKAALADVRHLHVDIYVHDNLFPNKWGPTLPPAGLPGLFVDVLAQMRNLERLDWGMSVLAMRKFEPAFVEKGLMLPSVRYLQPGAGGDYLVSRCPNVEVLDAGYEFWKHWTWERGRNHHSELIKASTGLEKLKEWRISTRHNSWTLDMLKDILSATPNITSLHMDGNLGTPEGVLREREVYNQWYFTRLDPETLKEYLKVFALFPNLENLQLPASRHLDMGFDGGAWCGNAYDGPGGRAYGRSVTQEHAETTQLAANVTMDALPRLKSLQVGSESANLTLNDLGQPDMTWPWTGRMKQYTHEIWEEEEEDDESAY